MRYVITTHIPDADHADHVEFDEMPLLPAVGDEVLVFSGDDGVRLGVVIKRQFQFNFDPKQQLCVVILKCDLPS